MQTIIEISDSYTTIKFRINNNQRLQYNIGTDKIILKDGWMSYMKDLTTWQSAEEEYMIE